MREIQTYLPLYVYITFLYIYAIYTVYIDRIFKFAHILRYFTYISGAYAVRVYPVCIEGTVKCLRVSRVRANKDV